MQEKENWPLLYRAILKNKGCWVFKAIYNYSNKQLGVKSKNGTKYLHSHLSGSPLRKQRDIRQTILNLKKDLTIGKLSLSTHSFNENIAKNVVARMVILHEYLLSMVDYVEFREYFNVL